MIDPKKVLIATPSYDGSVVCGYAGGMGAVFASGFAGGNMFLQGCADIGSARAQCAHAFLKSHFEWLVFIDADIQFTARDFGLLMCVEPNLVLDGQELKYSRTGESAARVGPEVLVSAEYSRKTEEQQPVRFGLGFTRIHRSVFEALAVFLDHEGKELVDQFFYQGEIMREYFPMTTLGDGRRMGEDGGFWTLCQMAGFTPRIEQRTQLVHWGRKAYVYMQSGMMAAQ